MTSTKFPIRIDPIWQPLMWPGGALPGQAYVEVDDQNVHIRMGYLFDHTIPRSQIESVSETTWPWWLGVGWRATLTDRFGLIGSYQNLVEIKLRAPMRVWRLLNCTRIVISLDEPQQFIAAVG